MGRKKHEVNWVKLDSYLQLMASKTTCFHLLDVSEDVLERRLREEFGLTFKEYAEKKAAPVKLKLVQVALDKAFKGDNTMLIFCLKNICQWSDKQIIEHEGNQEKPIQISRADLDERIKLIKGVKIEQDKK